MNKIDRLNNEIGYKEIKVLVSKDYTKLKINNDVYPLNTIHNAKVVTLHHDSVKVVSHEEENYNFLKGHVIAEAIDDPIGYLGGIETTEYYETKVLKRVELILCFKDKTEKRYVAGIFITTDSNLELCKEETIVNCKKVLSSIRKCPNYNETNESYTNEEVNQSILYSIMDGLWWFIKNVFMITMIVFFFPFSLIYLWFKFKKKE